MLKKIFSSELGRGAIILFVTINIFNFLNFLFHFFMGRILGPEDYGTLAVLMSIVYIYTIPTETIQTLISNYTSKLNLKKNEGEIKFLIIKSLKSGIILSWWVFLFATLIGFFVAKFLDINFWLIFITNIILFFAFSLPVMRGVLQGRKKFGALGGNLIIASLLKLFFAVSLVILGFKVFGAMIGILLGASAGLVFSFYSNKDILIKKEKKIVFDRIYSQSIPYLITMIVILLIFSLDILFAKKFFSAEFAGKYAVLSMLGKAIFLGTLAVSKVMFPLTSERYYTSSDSTGLFKKSLLLISLICVIIVAIYGFFPKLIIMVLYGSQYTDMYPYLVFSGIAFSFLSLTNLIYIYGLSTNRIKNTPFLFIFLAIEIILFYLFHANILEYITGFMVSNIIMFIGSFFFIEKQKD